MPHSPASDISRGHPSATEGHKLDDPRSPLGPAVAGPRAPGGPSVTPAVTPRSGPRVIHRLYIPNRIWCPSVRRSYIRTPVPWASPGQSGALRPGVDRWSPLSAPGGAPPPRGGVSVRSSGSVHHPKTPSNLQDAPVRPDNDAARLLCAPRSIWPTVIRRDRPTSLHSIPPPLPPPLPPAPLPLLRLLPLYDVQAILMM